MKVFHDPKDVVDVLWQVCRKIYLSVMVNRNRKEADKYPVCFCLVFDGAQKLRELSDDTCCCSDMTFKVMNANNVNILSDEVFRVIEKGIREKAAIIMGRCWGDKHKMHQAPPVYGGHRDERSIYTKLARMEIPYSTHRKVIRILEGKVVGKHVVNKPDEDGFTKVGKNGKFK